GFPTAKGLAATTSNVTRARSRPATAADSSAHSQLRRAGLRPERPRPEPPKTRRRPRSTRPQSASPLASRNPPVGTKAQPRRSSLVRLGERRLTDGPIPIPSLQLPPVGLQRFSVRHGAGRRAAGQPLGNLDPQQRPERQAARGDARLEV